MLFKKSRHSSVHWWTEIAGWPQNEKILLSLLQSYIQSGLRVIKCLFPTVLNEHSSNQQMCIWIAVFQNLVNYLDYLNEAHLSPVLPSSGRLGHMKRESVYVSGSESDTFWCSERRVGGDLSQGLSVYQEEETTLIMFMNAVSVVSWTWGASLNINLHRS